jgi:transcriptional regulator with XRE-family HTH domain
MIQLALVMQSIGERIAIARKLSGLSAAELGRRAKLSNAIVSMLEGGQREDPHVSTVTQIAAVLGARVEWLISGEGDGPTEEEVKTAVALTQKGAA